MAEGCDAVLPRLRSRPTGRWPPMSDRPAAGRARRAGGIGSAGARDPLAREVRLLGALLGQVITEQAGDPLFALVERLRRSAIALRRATTRPSASSSSASSTPSTSARPRPSSRPSRSTSSWSTLPRHGGASGRCAGASAPRATGSSTIRSRRPSPAAAARAGRTTSSMRSLGRLRISPVLTAHPTEARRRTALIALRRCADPARAPRRSAPDAVRGSRDPSPAARGDHAPVADRRPALDRARAARRGADGDGRFRRDAVHGRPAPVPRTDAALDAARRARARPPRGPGRARRACRRSCAGGRGSAATATATRRSRPRRPSARCGSRPTTSCAATRRSRPG